MADTAGLVGVAAAALAAPAVAAAVAAARLVAVPGASAWPPCCESCCEFWPASWAAIDCMRERPLPIVVSDPVSPLLAVGVALIGVLTTMAAATGVAETAVAVPLVVGSPPCPFPESADAFFLAGVEGLDAESCGVAAAAAAVNAAGFAPSPSVPSAVAFGSTSGATGVPEFAVAAAAVVSWPAVLPPEALLPEPVLEPEPLLEEFALLEVVPLDVEAVCLPLPALAVVSVADDERVLLPSPLADCCSEEADGLAWLLLI